MSTESFICDACRRIDFGKALRVLEEQLQNEEISDNMSRVDEPFPGDNNFRKRGILLDDDSSRFVAPPQTACKLCKVLSSVICWYHDYWSDPAYQADFEQDQKFQLRAFSFLQNCGWADSNVKGTEDSLILLAVPSNMFSAIDHASETGNGEAGYVVCYPRDFEPGLFKPQSVPAAYDPQTARLWLENCRDFHGAGCNTVPETTVPGMQLIDCDTRSIVDATNGMQWVALSYVWGPTRVSFVSSNPQTPFTIPLILPKTIEDAITVTKDLGYHVLWVDEYCIDQHNEEQKIDQISKMDLIYRGAELTLIAVAGQDKHHGLPGVSSTKRLQQDILHLDDVTILATGPDPVNNIQESKWQTRAWTYQEGYLSRRRLIFTEYQMYFQCQNVAWMEAIGGVERIEDQATINWTSWSWKIGSYLFPQVSCFDPLSVRPQWSIWDASHYQSRDPKWRLTEEDRKFEMDKLFAYRQSEFFSLTAKYTRRELSFDGDSLNAFAGMLRALERNDDVPILNFSGLPYLPSIEDCELMDTYLFSAFCWYHETPTTPRRRLDFPSWTWTGWAGKTRWMCSPMHHGSRAAEPKIRSLQLELSSRMLVGCEAMGIEETKQLLRSVKALNFEARYVPPTLFSMETTPGGEEEDGSGGGDTCNKEAYTSENGEGNDDWSNFLVSKHHLYLRFMQPPTLKPSQFLQRVRDGSWKCFLMGDYRSITSVDYMRFLLVVEQLDEETVVRVGAIVARSNVYFDEGNMEFFDEEGLEWRELRVV
jgi:hypothetical protein